MNALDKMAEMVGHELKGTLMDTAYNTICHVFTKNKIEYQSLNCGPAGKAIVAPALARVIGVWTDPAAPSHLWMNREALPTINIPKDSWFNSGGHRIWIAPERQFFISDMNDPFGTYLAPAAIDPGSWRLESTPGEAILSTKTMAHAHGINKQVPITIVRKITPLDTIPFKLPSPDIAWAGYQETASLETNMELRVGLWSLLQVPLDGVAAIPSQGAYKTFFGDEKQLTQQDSEVLRIRYDPGRNVYFKVCLKASQLKGNMLFYEIPSAAGVRFLAVLFERDNDDAYVDHPWSTPEDIGYVVQFFCGGSFGFGELEIHGACWLEKKTYRSQLNISVLAFECPLMHAKAMRQLLLEAAKDEPDTIHSHL